MDFFDSKIKIIWLWLLSVWCLFWLPNVCWWHIIVSSYCVGYETYVEDMWFICPYAVEYDVKFNSNKLCGRPTICPRPLQVDLWPFNLESDVRVTCDAGYLVPILVFLGLSVIDLGPMYAIDRQTDVRRASSFYDALCASRLSWLVIIFAMLYQLNKYLGVVPDASIFGCLIDHTKWLFVVFLTALFKCC